MGDVPGQQSLGTFPNQSHSNTTASSKSPSVAVEALDTQHGMYIRQSGGLQQGNRSPYTTQHPSAQPRHVDHFNAAGQHGGNFMNMGALGNALPETGYMQGYTAQSPQPSIQTSTSHIGSPYSIQHSPQYPGQNVSYLPQYQTVYGGHLLGQRNSQQSSNVPHQFYQYPQQAPQMSSYYYPQGQVTSQLQQIPTGVFQPNAGRGGVPVEHAMAPGYQSEMHGSIGLNHPAYSLRSGSMTSGSGSPTIPRGPPRKPKQSGHALWVGNLPPTANVSDLKDHFSRDATEDILSVFLISKSNCAFVNYKSEQSCAAAMARFHDSRFRETRLVCRLRRTQVSGVPTGPAALTMQAPKSPTLDSEVDAGSGEAISPTEVASKAGSAQDRYFIVKSLTVEDLDLSVRNGQWATQSHNEETLNKAFESAESVFLIFSANKSGEYYGYAKMVSRINEDPAAAIEFAPKALALADPELPKAIITVATEFAPKGRIIDDSARGSIFWEAETGDDETSADNEDEQADEVEGDNPEKAWGKPFKIEWMSTDRLPFYRTRGLRNPWNSNREVKIARDGTELETSVGRRLVQMFHREQVSAPPHAPVVPMPQMGYPPMRPY